MTTQDTLKAVVQIVLRMSAQVMDRDAKLMRQEGPTIFSQAKHNVGIAEIADLILKAHKAQTQSLST